MDTYQIGWRCTHCGWRTLNKDLACQRCGFDTADCYVPLYLEDLRATSPIVVTEVKTDWT